jgi:uncharacterized repeat protein (TIGR01451 family)
MKRWMVRLAMLSAATLVGLILFAHAYRGKWQTPSSTVEEPATAGESSIKPIPIAADEAPPAANDPFAGRSRLVEQTEERPTTPASDDRYAQIAHKAPAIAEESAAAENTEPQHLDAPADAAPLTARGNPFRGTAVATAGEGTFVERAANNSEETARNEQPSEKAQGALDAAAAFDEQEAKPEPSADNRYSKRPMIARVDRSPERTNDPPSAQFAEPEDDLRTNASAFAPPAGRPERANLGGSGRPGARQLEGAQSPSLQIEKTAPAEIQVGKPATFTVRVRNAGQIAAEGVEIHDEVPQGAELVSTRPTANEVDGKLVWQLGTLKPGDETTVQLQVTPLTEGEIGSVATVTFRANASVRSVVTRPQLKVDVQSPQKVMIGEDAMLRIRISNPGSGPAGGIVLSEQVPAGFKHPGGEELEFEVGTLKPGESRELELSLTAVQPGKATNVLKAVGEAGLEAIDQDEIEVIAPALKVGLQGPKRRYLGRNATYTVSVINPGTAPSKDISLTATLPRGLKFEEANNQGHYDAATHRVTWSLEQLPPGETGNVTLSTTATEPGTFNLDIKATAKQDLADAIEEPVTVEGVAAILFELVDVNDPIEVGGETTYEIRVINQGSAAATNVRIVALLPPEMKALDADGPVRHTIDGQRVLFDALGQLAPKADTMYSVKVQGDAPGDLRLRVQIMTDQTGQPITKEESTRVYADE